MLEIGAILENRSGENRWTVTGMKQSSPVCHIYRVKDNNPEMNRELDLMVLNYDNLPCKNMEMEIGDLRHSFFNMIRILCGNYTFLPEPVDHLDIYRNDRNLPDRLKKNDPGLVFSMPSGSPVITGNRGRYDKKYDEWKEIYRIVRSCLFTLDSLHNNNVVMQAIPMHSILMSRTTFQPYFLGIETLVRMSDFKGYNSNRADMRPDRIYCAPECYDPSGYLSPATDMYALGKLVIQLAVPGYKKIFSHDNPFPDDIQNRINGLNIPDIWKRMLALCLHPSPGERFQKGAEVIYFLKGSSSNQNTSAQNASAKNTSSGTNFSGDSKPAYKTSFQPPPSRSWSYRQNAKLPSAALVIFGDDLTDFTEQFDFMAFYHEVLLKFNLTPRLFVTRKKNALQSNKNAFHNLIESKFKLEITSSDIESLAAQIQPSGTLILVSSASSNTVINFMKKLGSANMKIFWFRRGMGSPAPVRVESITDAELYIRKKKQ